MSSSRSIAVACSALALVGFAAPSHAGAAAPGVQAIKVCVKKSNGDMRLAKSKKSCHKGERFEKLTSAEAGATLKNVRVFNINVICNNSTETGGTTAAQPTSRVQTIQIPDSRGGTLSVGVVCGDSAAG